MNPPRLIAAVIGVLLLMPLMLWGYAAAGDPSQDAVEACWKVFGFEKQLRAGLEQMLDNPDGLSLELSKEEVGEFWERLEKDGALKRIESQGKKLIAKNFSESELKALSEFYSSPQGRSIMAKMPKFTAEANLMLNEEFLPAAQRILGEMNNPGDHH